MNSILMLRRTLILISFLMFTAIASGQKSKNEPSVGENLEEISFLLNKDKHSAECLNTLGEELENICRYEKNIILIEDLNDYIQINLSEQISASIESEMKTKEQQLAPIKRLDSKIDKPKISK